MTLSIASRRVRFANAEHGTRRLHRSSVRSPAFSSPVATVSQSHLNLRASKTRRPPVNRPTVTRSRRAPSRSRTTSTVMASRAWRGWAADRTRVTSRCRPSNARGSRPAARGGTRRKELGAADGPADVVVAAQLAHRDRGLKRVRLLRRGRFEFEPRRSRSRSHASSASALT